jgi:nitrate/TMAO reductase-like tetraheme cytochrome c subunit
MKKRFPVEVYNPISLSGAVVSALSSGLIVFLIIVEFFTTEHKPYVGILTFIILPAILIIGLLLIAFGIFREYRRKSQGVVRDQRLPVINFNDPRQFRAFSIFSSGTLLLIIATTFGSFKAYEYTDSDEFCGTVCHKVMEPEYTAYQSSPHSRVGCVKCHIGSGTDWFVRAKISGSYQVYSVIFNKYSRPIGTPIENLRPAQETCEQCHWPKQFYGQKKVTLYHFLSDEANTKSSTAMLLKIGEGNKVTGALSGIHWHINVKNGIWYYSADEKRQHIPYVKMIEDNGNVSVFTEKGFDVSKVKEDELRRMDCIDCHNRPSHIYNEPDRMLNMNLSSGRIDSTLPYIKSIGMNVLEAEYIDTDEASTKISSAITSFYQANYPEVISGKGEQVRKSIAAIQEIYSKNYFPYMKVSWKKFPDHIGHVYYDGCFRCHDGKHFSKQNRTISKECNSCHLIIEQQGPEGSRFSPAGLEFIHPGGLTQNIQSQKCSDCHGAGKKNKN